eukprot:2551717-Prymnesium_polylepis.2
MQVVQIAHPLSKRYGATAGSAPGEGAAGNTHEHRGLVVSLLPEIESNPSELQFTWLVNASMMGSDDELEQSVVEPVTPRRIVASSAAANERAAPTPVLQVWLSTTAVTSRTTSSCVSAIVAPTGARLLCSTPGPSCAAKERRACESELSRSVPDKEPTALSCLASCRLQPPAACGRVD